MDLEQLQKRVQWIEDDRRKEKDALALLESRMVNLEGGLSALGDQIKDLAGEITRLSAVVTRMDQYDDTLVQVRTEARRAIDEMDKDVKKRDEEADKVHRVELKAIETSLNELRKELDLLPRLEKGMQARVEEENNLRRAIEETRERIDAVRREEEEYTRTVRLLEDGRRQDSKRMLDMQGEVTALRKRADDQRGQVEILSTNQRKLEGRLAELANVEAERRDAVSGFLDKQALVQVERDRAWKEWQARFETIEQQAEDVEAKLLTLDATQRETKRAQAALEELSQRVERRINEITEIQRLSEDRFRQEWVAFKADDQKRWTNYTLTQDEQRSEVMRQFEKLSGRTTQLEDGLQELQDLLQQTNELLGKRLQSQLALVHDWVAAFERTK